jgi:SHS2 domain-containing protein
MPLKYKGYIYTQASAVYPAELRGVLIRVRNVAIGDYDLNCLNYEIVQGFRFDWVSGEIYVEEGLEDALNVDRHSFNEVHPHYLSLQNELHSLLKEGGVFKEARKAADIAVDKGANQTTTDEGLTTAVFSVLNVGYRIARVEESNPRNNPLEIDDKNNIITIYKHPVWPRSKTARVVAEQIIVAYKLAQEHTSNIQNAEKIAYSILQKVFQV